MPEAPPTPARPPASRTEPWAPVVLLIGGLLLARIVYLVWFCPYSLIEDEAHYWEWSRRLGWSYYSKGPGIAWAIAACTRLFGVDEWTVRLPAVIASAAAMTGLSALAHDIFRSARSALFTAACFALTPLFQVPSLISTIDMPYTACWAWAAWAAWRALARRSGHAWVVLGIGVGIGFLFKYTTLLVLPGILGFALAHRRRLDLSRAWWAWASAGLALVLLGMTPVAVWNSRHGWPTLHHLLGHLGIAGGDVAVTQGSGHGWHWNPSWTLGFVGSQLGMVGPVLVLAWFACRNRVARADATDNTTNDADRPSPRNDADAVLGRAFLVWCAAPIIVVYALLTFVAEAEGNWVMAGYSTLMPLAGRAAATVSGPLFGGPNASARTPSFHAWRATLMYGLVAGLGMLRVDLLAKLPSVGAWVPAGRLIGADLQARDAARHADELRSRTGLEPFFIAQHYGVAGRLAFYLPGHPIVYCSSSRMNGRKTQYDFWADTDLGDLPVLAGRPAVMVGAEPETWKRAFDHVEPVGPLDTDHKKRPAFVGTGYRGFRPAAKADAKPNTASDARSEDSR